MSEDWMNDTQEPEVPVEPEVPAPPQPPAENRYSSYTPYGGNWEPPTGGGTTPPAKPPKKRKNGLLITLVAVLGSVFLIAAVLTGIELANRGGVGSLNGEPSTHKTTTTGNSEDRPAVVIRDDTDADAVNTAQIVADNVDVTVLINVYAESSQKDFFGYGIESGTKTESLAGQASGIVMSSDGYIITNQHVVVNEKTNKPFDRVEVQFYNGSVYNAEVVGSDSDTDLAVVKIQAKDLKVATFGNSDNAVLGERVITIGCSGGLPWSVSQGIISGKDRDVYDETGYQIQCLQVDATINPGNSGGPLFNSRGEVIGINSAKIVYEGYENLGFSIPISEAKPVLDDLIKHGKVTGRVELGITGYDVNQSGIVGFLIKTVEKGSCLEGTKVQVSDVITAVDGAKISSRTELRNQLSKHKVGDQVKLAITRVTARKSSGGYYGFGAQYSYETEQFDVTVTLKEG